MEPGSARRWLQTLAISCSPTTFVFSIGFVGSVSPQCFDVTSRCVIGNGDDVEYFDRYSIADFILRF